MCANNDRCLTTESDWSTASIDDYVNDVAIVWADHDVRRSMIDVWMRVVQRASELGELVRRRRYDHAEAQLGRVAIWMLTFIAKGRSNLQGIDSLFRLDRPMSELLWRKYPNCCPTCYSRRVALSEEREKFDGQLQQCNCILTLLETEDRKVELPEEVRRKAAEDRRSYAAHHSADGCPYESMSLDDVEKAFASIFKRNIYALDLEHVTFHFLEEVGEVVDAMTRLYTFAGDGVDNDTPAAELNPLWQKARQGLEDELADAFSWLFAVSSKFRDYFEVIDQYTSNTKYAEDMTIVSHLKKRHMREPDSLMKCWDCGAEICRCGIKLITTGEAAEEVVSGDGTGGQR